MKKHHLYLIFFYLLPQLLQAQLATSGGVNLVMGNSTYLVLDNMGLQNNGSFNQNAGTVMFTGASQANITGSSFAQFNILELAKPSGLLQLRNSIGIKGVLDFTDGLLDLNGKVISLGSTGTLHNESETNHLIGALGGYVEAVGNINASTSANLGNLGATISSPNSLGVTIIRRTHVVLDAGGVASSILRSFAIIPTNNANLGATF